MNEFTIKDITGQIVTVMDVKEAIEQCRRCANSPFIMDSGYTVGENHRFMLEQLQNKQSHIAKQQSI